jgi:hypothetical protein
MQTPSSYRTIAFYYRSDKSEACQRYMDIKQADFHAPAPELTMVTLNPACQDGDDTPLNQEVEIQADDLVLRIQEFMQREGLTWVRVLNLSDLQENSTDTFFKKLGHIQDVPEHSIFHPSREAELRAHANSNTPFLLAWGTDPRGGILANTVVKQIREKGYPIVNPTEPFLHPLATPIGGIPSWTEYADAAFKSFLKEKAAKRTDTQSIPGNVEQQITGAFEEFTGTGTTSIIITEAKENGRWDRFAELIRAAGLHHYIGTSDYDYVLIQNPGSGKTLHELLVKHNGRKIIIDATTDSSWLDDDDAFALLKTAWCDKVISGLKPQPKRASQQPEEEAPVFKGQIVLLVAMTRAQLEASTRYSCLLADAVVV